MKKLLLLVLLATCIPIFCMRASAQGVVFIANSSVKGSEYSKADVRDVFTGASSTLKSGSQVTPVVLKQGVVHEDFLTRFVGKSDSAFRANWRSIVFSGQGVMPRTVDSESAMVEYVAHTAGAVGYIGKPTLHEGIKTLAVR